MIRKGVWVPQKNQVLIRCIGSEGMTILVSVSITSSSLYIMRVQTEDLLGVHKRRNDKRLYLNWTFLWDLGFTTLVSWNSRIRGFTDTSSRWGDLINGRVMTIDSFFTPRQHNSGNISTLTENEWQLTKRILSLHFTNYTLTHNYVK